MAISSIPHARTCHRYRITITKRGTTATTSLFADNIDAAARRARAIFNKADALTVTQAPPSALDRRAQLREAYAQRRPGRRRRVSGALLAAAVLAAMLLAGCSGGTTEPPAPDPVITCDSQGNCWTGTDEPDPPAEPPTADSRPTPAEYNAEPNGRAWYMWMAPGGYIYSDDSGVCLLRWPYEPGPAPYNSIVDFQGACFSAYHHDWFFRFQPFKRTGDKWIDVTTSTFRGERRLHEVVGGKLTGAYDVTGDFLGSFYSEGSLHDDFRLYWNGGNKGMQADSIALNATTPGVYSRARRNAGTGCLTDCTTNLAAPFLNVGVETSLRIDADGAVYAQGADGCTVRGQTGDHLGGVWRAELTHSCVPGTFEGFGGTVGDRVYIGAVYRLDHFVIVGER